MDFFLASDKEFEFYIKEFCDLYKRCFGQVMTEEEARWRYLDNPQKKVLAWFAVEKGKLIANYAVSPLYLYDNGQIVCAALSVNTMVHPDYMRRGLVVKMAGNLYKYMKEEGFQCVIGFPNHIFNRTLVGKLGWRNIYEIPMMILDITTVDAGAFKQTLKIEEDNRFQKSYSKCASFKEKVSVYKDNEYLKWRYGNHPIIEYKNYVICEKNDVRSRIVFKEYQDRVNMVDYCFENLEEGEQLLNAVIEYAKASGKKYVTVWSGLFTVEHKIFEMYGFKNSSPVTYFGIKDLNEDRYHNYSDWMVQMGDDNAY